MAHRSKTFGTRLKPLALGSITALVFLSGCVYEPAPTPVAVAPNGAVVGVAPVVPAPVYACCYSYYDYPPYYYGGPYYGGPAVSFGYYGGGGWHDGGYHHGH